MFTFPESVPRFRKAPKPKSGSHIVVCGFLTSTSPLQSVDTACRRFNIDVLEIGFISSDGLESVSSSPARRELAPAYFLTLL